MIQAKLFQKFTYFFIFSASIFFAVQLYNFIKRQAVNVLFFDQWDFLTPLFGSPTIWEMFTFQHGPHRQGLGLFYSSFIGWLTNWNTRAESFGIGFILLLVTIGAFILKWRLFGKFTIWDILIAAICFSFMQLESIVLTPNPAHGAIPILLVIIAGIVLSLENFYFKYLGLTIISFFATYTGFGFFLGLIIPVILIISLLTHWSEKNKLAIKILVISLLFSILSTASFFINYRFNPVQDCFQFPFSDPLNYLSFIGLQLSMFFGFHSMQNLLVSQILGTLTFFALVSFGTWQIWILWKSKRFESRAVIIFLLISFSLLFALNSTSGRICGGLGAAQSSRYMTLLIPCFLGLYFAIQDLLESYSLYITNSILIILFIVLPLINMKDFTRSMNNFSEVKKGWAKCYLEKENIETCNKEAGNVVYPNPEATRMKEKLDLLKEKKYNLFADK